MILNMCKDVLGRLPKVVGIDVVELALWAKVTDQYQLVQLYFCFYPIKFFDNVMCFFIN